MSDERLARAGPARARAHNGEGPGSLQGRPRPAEGEELFETLVEYAPFGVYLVDEAFRLRAVNKGAQQVFSGIDPLIGRDFAEVLRIVWREPFATEAIERFRHTLRSGESFLSPPIVQPRANIDEIQSYDWQIHRVTLPDGSYGAVCYFYDLSEQKRLEERVRRSARRDAFLVRLTDLLRPLADAVHIEEAASRLLGEYLEADRVGFAEPDADGASLTVDRDWTSPGTFSIVGTHRYEEFGTFFVSPLLEGRPSAIDDAATDPRVSADTYATGWRRIGARGAIAYPLVKLGRLVGAIFVHQCTPRRWTESEITLVVEVAERTWLAIERARAEASIVESERRLAALNRQLSEASQRKDEFLAMLGHELRNPLGVITNAVQLIRTLHLPHPVLEKALGAAQRQSAHMARLVEELLDVSRITEGKVTLKQEIVTLTQVLEAALETARPLIDASRHRLHVALPEAPLRMAGDPVRLVQVVGNLLNNAAKYTPPGGDIHVTLERSGDTAVIRVRDTGQGMPEDLLKSVFDLFVQGSRTTDRAQGGLGIGLTLARRLVEMHGGRIDAASPGVGRGSEFTVHLPLLDERPVVQAGASAEGTAQAPRRRVLVVDDHADGAEMLRLLLQHEGHEVEAVGDGLTALSRAAEFKPEFVILDIGMPDMDGYEVADRLRRDPATASMTLIALTGYGQDADTRRSRARGFDAHLVKPVNVAALRRVLA